MALNAIAEDGSGYQLSVSLTGNSSPSQVSLTSLRAKSGTSIKAPLISGSNAGGSVTDTNGNQIAVAYSAGTTTFTDTLGTTALTVTGSGTVASPLVYTYTNPQAAPSRYTVNYANFTVKTNFACTGKGEYGGAGGTAVPLVSSVVLPDGTQYSFAYEPTLGSSGYVTGRLASVTLPSGGTINWHYYSGSTAANTITCADGSGMNLQRISSDGTTSFSRVESPSWQTTLTDGLGNDTVMNFQSQAVSNTIYSYETQRQTYQLSHTSGTLLQTANTGYNGSPSSSPCVAGTLSLPISQVAVNTTWPYNNNANNVQSQVCSNYDTANAGRLTQATQYAFGIGSLGTTIKRQTSYSYATLGNGIYTAPSEIKITDGTTTYADTQYQYDQGTPTTTSNTPQHVSISGSRGNATTIKQLTTGASYLTTTQTFFDTGNVQTVTDPNTIGQTTQVYSAGSCGNSFPTSTTLPLSLSRSYTWDCNGAVQLTLTDENGNQWATAYADANFWRATSTTDPTSATTSISYPNSQTTTESTLTFNGGSSTSDTRVTLDSYGRTQVSQVKQGPAATSYDSVQVYYDATGRPKISTIPYVGAASQAGVTSTGTTITYDTLGRPLTVTDASGGNTSYAYQANDVLLTMGPAPSGERVKSFNDVTQTSFGWVR